MNFGGYFGENVFNTDAGHDGNPIGIDFGNSIFPIAYGLSSKAKGFSYLDFFHDIRDAFKASILVFGFAMIYAYEKL